MKKLIILLVLSTFSASIIQAQHDYSTKSKKAIEYFNEAWKNYNIREYDQALEFLNKALDKDDEFIEAYIVKGQVYEAMNEPGKALDNYRKAIGVDPDYYPKLYYSIGYLHQNQGRYEEAKKSFRTFLEYESIGPIFRDKTKMKIKSCHFAIHQKQNPVDFEPENLGYAVNSQYNDYWPSLSADGKTLVFTRLIPVENAEELKRQMDELPEPRRRMMMSINPLEQEDFFVSYKSDTGWMQARNLGDPLNSDDNEGAQTLSADGKTMYFSACNRKDSKGGCDIYVTHKKDDQWTKPKNIGAPVNTINWESQPSISPDGRTLYYASERKGGKGKKDIWMSTLKSDSTWTKPVNLGDSINTPGEDIAPFIHLDNQTLYFASDGWPGMGNLDLFKSRKKNDSVWSEPVNLGYPINTHKNEVGIIVNTLGTEAFYSSNREEGMEKDIYSFKLPEAAQPVSSSYMRGRVYDAETNEPLKAHFELISLNNENLLMDSYSDKNDGKFLVSIPSNNDYLMNVSKKGYLFYSDNFQLEGKYEASEPFEKDIPLKPIKEGEKIILRNVFYELDSYELKDESKVELDKLYGLLKENPTLMLEISGHTDSLGTNEYNIELSENRAQSVYNYLVEKGIDEDRLTYKGYGETQPIAPNRTEKGRALNRRTEVKVIKK